MPASQVQDPRRAKLLQGLFWGGIGLAPLAMLILLFSQSTGMLRVAVILSVLTVVALALSIGMRPSVEMVRVDIEHRVLDEVEHVRASSREDITVAARNTHRALSERIYELTETIDALRAQTGRIYELTETMDALRAQVDELQHAPALVAGPPQAAVHHTSPTGNAGVVRRTETVHVTRRTTTVDADDDDARGTVYGSRAAVDGEWRERPEDRRGDDRRPDDRRPDDRRADGRRHEERRDDRHRDDGRPEDRPYQERSYEDRSYDGRRRAERVPDDRRSDDRRRDERHRDDVGYAGFDRDHLGGADQRSSGARAAYEVARRESDQRWEGSGDRWASVRADEHGRELRVGERIASVRKDDRGTEFRVEDRWTALRREEPRDRVDDGYQESDWEATFRSLSSKPPAMPALPAARGESPERFLDERPYDLQPVSARGRDRERDVPPPRGAERGHGSERDWAYDADRAAGYDRDAGYGRDAGYDRGAEYESGRDQRRVDRRPPERDREDPRGPERDRSYAPRPRSPHESEWDR